MRNDLWAFEREFADVEPGRSRLESSQYLARMGPFPGHTVSSPLEIGYYATRTLRHSITQVPQPSPVDHYRACIDSGCERTAGRSVRVVRRNALAGRVTTATVFPSMSKNSTL